MLSLSSVYAGTVLITTTISSLLPTARLDGQTDFGGQPQPSAEQGVLSGSRSFERRKTYLAVFWRTHKSATRADGITRPACLYYHSSAGNAVSDVRTDFRAVKRNRFLIWPVCFGCKITSVWGLLQGLNYATCSHFTAKFTIWPVFLCGFNSSLFLCTR